MNNKKMKILLMNVWESLKNNQIYLKLQNYWSK
mgnify:CR=1 FL=1